MFIGNIASVSRGVLYTNIALWP